MEGQLEGFCGLVYGMEGLYTLTDQLVLSVGMVMLEADQLVMNELKELRRR